MGQTAGFNWVVDEGLLIKTSTAPSLSCGAGDLRCKADMNTKAENKEDPHTHTQSPWWLQTLYIISTNN